MRLKLDFANYRRSDPEDGAWISCHLSGGRRQLLTALLGAGILSACSDVVRPPPDDRAPEADAVVLSVNGTTVSYAAMQERMARVARQVALAINDAGMRRRVYEELQASPFRENKLHFRTLVDDPSLGLRGTMANATGSDEAAVTALLDSLVDLEFYMPVKEHWAAWAGDGNLLVASGPDDNGSVPRGFDLAGREVTLSAEDPPNTPMLVLTPVETNFSSPPNPAEASVAASLIAMPYADSAFMMQKAWIIDDHEAYWKGDPEFEVHTWQEQPSGIVEVVICSSEAMPIPYNWDMNSSSWSGSVHLATQAILDTTVITEFHMWEDDTDQCNNSGGGKPPKTSTSWIDVIESSANLIFEIVTFFDSQSKRWDKIKAGFKAAGHAYDLQTTVDADDFVGFMIGPEGGCWPPREDGAARFVIREEEGGSVKGDAMIEVTYGERDPLCALSVDIEGPNPVYNCDPLDPVPNPPEFEAVVFGGDGSPITYAWKEDGNSYGSASSHVLQDHSPGTRRLEVLVHRGAEEALDVLFVQVVQEDPEASEICEA